MEELLKEVLSFVEGDVRWWDDAAQHVEELASGLPVTGPSFCTTVNEKVYITTSSGKDAKGGSQGAVGDRRATLCGANVAGAGGL